MDPSDVAALHRSVKMDICLKESKEVTVAEQHSLPLDKNADPQVYPGSSSGNFVSKLHLTWSLTFIDVPSFPGSVEARPRFRARSSSKNL
jgi:hypothetical protein